MIAHSTTGTNSDARAGDTPLRRAVALDSPAETEAFARRLAAIARPGDLFALSGKLGAGKSHFARHFIRAATGDTAIDVPSPTFTLAQSYEARIGTIWHFDLYRIVSSDELDELGWDDARPGIMLVEWPARAGARLPADRLDIEFAFAAAAEARQAHLVAYGAWVARLRDLAA